MLKIRLSRGGGKKKPFYRIIVADARSPRDSRFIEKLGYYNPTLAKNNESRLYIDEVRIKYWLGVGARPTDRISRFLGERSLVAKFDAKAKAKVQTKQHLPRLKTLEKAKAKEEKLAALAKTAQETVADKATQVTAAENESKADDIANKTADKATQVTAAENESKADDIANKTADKATQVTAAENESKADDIANKTADNSQTKEEKSG